MQETEEELESTELVNQDGQKAKHPHGNNTGLKQAYDFRDLAAKEAMALQECVCTSLEDKVTRARALKDLNSVWYASSERIRILRGRPMPGSLRPIAKPKKVRQVSTKPLETLPESDVSGSTSTVQSKACLKESLSTELPSPPSGGV